MYQTTGETYSSLCETYSSPCETYSRPCETYSSPGETYILIFQNTYSLGLIIKYSFAQL